MRLLRWVSAAFTLAALFALTGLLWLLGARDVFEHGSHDE